MYRPICLAIQHIWGCCGPLNIEYHILDTFSKVYRVPDIDLLDQESVIFFYILQ